MGNKLLYFLLVFVIGTGIFATCSLLPGSDGLTPVNTVKTLKDKEQVLKLEELDENFTKGMNQFAYNLYGKIKERDNLIISPYSITLALSMIYNGADGNTRTELAELFGYDALKDFTAQYSKDSNEYMNANMKLLIDSLHNADAKAKVNIGNSIWISEKNQFSDSIEDSFLAPARNYFDGDIYQADFSREKTLEYVNRWVSNKTEGMIEHFLDSFGENLRLLLVNAVYFDGKWTVPFQKYNTQKDHFQGTERTGLVNMMNSYENEYRYLCRDGVKALEIPYGNERVVMDVLIPEKPNTYSIDELYNQLTLEELTSFINELDDKEKTKITTLSMPKFEIEYNFEELNRFLQELGMKTAFHDTADFDLIGNDLFLDQVSHKAKIIVEEWGTKAAAATSVNTTGSVLIENPINFQVNVPFLFFIRDRETKTILFIGKINNL